MQEGATTRVILVDDHAVLRGGIARILERAGGFEVVAEASQGPEALALVRETWPDVCVLDLDMPGGGLGLIGELLDAQPSLRILVFSQHAERDYALRSLEMGAHGYLPKTSGLEAVEAAVRRVASGHRFLSDDVQDLLVDRMTGRTLDVPHEALSPRELEIVRLLAAGRRNAEIAAELGLSAKTVSTHRTNALAKLGLETTIDLALYAREHGLI